VIGSGSGRGSPRESDLRVAWSGGEAGRRNRNCDFNVAAARAGGAGGTADEQNCSENQECCTEEADACEFRHCQRKESKHWEAGCEQQSKRRRERKKVVRRDSRARWPKGRARVAPEIGTLLLSSAHPLRLDVAETKGERQAMGAGCSTPIPYRTYPVRQPLPRSSKKEGKCERNRANRGERVG